jgi:hypothetical protein
MRQGMAWWMAKNSLPLHSLSGSTCDASFDSFALLKQEQGDKNRVIITFIKERQ